MVNNVEESKMSTVTYNMVNNVDESRRKQLIVHD
jgi:hypothetical protein